MRQLVALGKREDSRHVGRRTPPCCRNLPPLLALSPSHAPLLSTSPTPAGKVTPRPEHEQLILEFGEVLPRRGAMLWLAFRYNLRAGLAGFYR